MYNLNFSIVILKRNSGETTSSKGILISLDHQTGLETKVSFIKKNKIKKNTVLVRREQIHFFGPLILNGVTDLFGQSVVKFFEVEWAFEKTHGENCLEYFTDEEGSGASLYLTKIICPDCKSINESYYIICTIELTKKKKNVLSEYPINIMVKLSLAFILLINEPVISNRMVYLMYIQSSMWLLTRGMVSFFTQLFVVTCDLLWMNMKETVKGKMS